MSVEFQISNQYLRSNRKKGFVSFISGVSMIGLILAVMSLITVMSVMNGFHEELTNRVLNTISHAYVTGSDDTIESWDDIQTKINSNDRVITSSPYVEDFALMTSKSASQGVSVRGILIDQESSTSVLLDDIKYGSSSLEEDQYSVIIGVGLATLMGSGVGDQITLIAPARNALGILVPQSQNFVVGGIFNAGLNDYNNGLAFIHLYDAQDLFNLGNKVSGIRLKVDDLFDANIITSDVVKSLGEGFYGVDWMQQQKHFIRALNLEKQMIAIILSLIIAVAAFNIVSMMVMVVTDKKSDIAILRTLGMTPKRIVKIFYYQGISIGIIGIGLGTILGVLLALNIESVISGIESVIGFQFFPKDVFYINRFPSKIIPSDVISIIVGSFVLVMIAAIYPAKRAGKINISEVLRHE